MVVIPYIVGGLYAGIAHKRGATRAAVWIGILPAIAEKVLIFLIGSCYVIMEGSPITWENVMMFVSAEAVPYYTVNADFILTHHRRFRIDPPGDFLLVRW